MKSKLLPIADLNAILLSIFLVLSLGASRGYLKGDGQPVDPAIEAELREDKPPEEFATTYAMLLGVESAVNYQMGAGRAAPSVVGILRSNSATASPGMPSCFSVSLGQRKDLCFSDIQSFAKHEEAVVLINSACVPSSKSPVALELKRRIGEHARLLDPGREDYQFSASGKDGVSVYFNQFDAARERQIRLLQEGDAAGPSLAIYGIVCRGDPNLTRELVDTMTKQCSTSQNKTVLISGPDAGELRSIEYKKAVAIFENFYSSETAPRYVLYSRDAASEDFDVLRLSLPTITPNAKSSDYRLFQNNDECENYLKTGKVIRDKSIVSSFAELFQIEISQGRLISTYGFEVRR